MCGVSTRWAVAAGLQFLVVTVTRALPPSVVWIEVIPDLRMRFEVTNQRATTDVDAVMQTLENDLLDVGSTFYESPPDYFVQKDDRCDVIDLGVPGYALSMFAPGRTPVTWLEEIALPYGALIWMRQWKDVGWLPKVNYSAHWTDSRLPGGRSETTGSIGFETFSGKLSTHIGHFNASASPSVQSTTTSKRARRRSSTNGTNSTNNTNANLPSDPWHYTAEFVDEEFYNFRKQYFEANQMVALAMDCNMKFLFEVRICSPLIVGIEKENVRNNSYFQYLYDQFGLLARDTRAYPISAQPLIYGAEEGIRIELEAVVSEDPNFEDKITYYELDSVTRAAIKFYRQFAPQGGGWGPTVSILAKGFDGEQEYGLVNKGWIGRSLIGPQ